MMNFRKTIPSAILCILLLISLTAGGCKSVPPINPLPDAESWDIGVAAAKVVAAEGIGQGEGKDKPDLSLTVPPSDKPTQIDLYRKAQTLKQRVKEAMSNAPAYNVKSDNQDVKASQPKKSIWWRWLMAVILGLFVLAAVVMTVARRVANWSPWGFVKKMLGKKE